MSSGRVITIIYFLSISLCTLGGVPADSISKNPRTKFISEAEFDRQSGNYVFPDSSLNGIQQYRNRYTLGNIGLATTNPYFPNDQRELGYSFAPNNFQAYTFQPHKLEYCDTKSPFTELLFLVDFKKKELVSKFIHSQNINKNFNITANFQRIRSDGIYKRQSANHTDFALSGNYKSPNRRYFLLSNIIYNSLSNAENGGITADSAFENLELRDRNLLDINLLNANRKYRSRSIYLKQFINLGNKTAPKDSTGRAIVKPTSVIAHSILVQDELTAYSDQNPLGGFYDKILRDSARTFDSTYMYRIENELTWRLLQNKSDGALRPVGFQVGVKHQLVRMEQYTAWDTLKETSKLPNRRLFDRNIQNIILNAELLAPSGRKLEYLVRGDYVVNGYNAGDYNLGLFVKCNLIDSLQFIGLSGNVTGRKPQDIFLNYNSNHYQWENHFANEFVQSAGAFYKSIKYKFEFGASVRQYTNYVYFNQHQPAQETTTIQGFSAYANKSFYLWHFVFKNKITYQYMADSSVIKVPQFVTEHSLYYENVLFKKALYFQFGVDVSYNSAYYANGYLPALGQFYLQSEKKIGDYPYVDVFLNMKISRARIFVKYENVNSYLGYFNYYYALHYPYADGSFKFGVIWRFFD